MAGWLSGLPPGWTGIGPLDPAVLNKLLQAQEELPHGRTKCCDLFSGCFALGLGAQKLLDTNSYVEWNPYAQQVLRQRMQEGCIPQGPIFSDITQVRASELPSDTRGLKAGFPCPDISSAGLQGGFKSGNRSVLFFEIIRLIDEFSELGREIMEVLLENVSAIISQKMCEAPQTEFIGGCVHVQLR